MHRAVTVLHLSDLRLGRGRYADQSAPLPTDPTPGNLFPHLRDDLRRIRDDAGRPVTPDVLLLTGDLTDSGRPSEFQGVLRLIEALAAELRLPRDRVVLLPGNRDVSRDACAAYFSGCQAEEVDPRPPYWPKWRFFSSCFREYYRDHPAVGFTEGQPWTFFEMKDLKVVIAALNSTMAESHRPEDHYGLIGKEQMEWFATELATYRRAGWLRLAALHHTVRPGPTRSQETLYDAEEFRGLLGPLVSAVFHGHPHDAGTDRLHPQVPIFSAGTAAPPLEAFVESTPNYYQVVRFRLGRIDRWVRPSLPVPGSDATLRNETFELDLDDSSFSLTASGDDEEPLEDTHDDRPPSRPAPGRGPDEDDGSEGDDFLSRAEAALRLRERPGAEIKRLREGRPPIEYLRVSVPDGGIVRVYPLGVLEHGATREGLGAFLDRVDARYREGDTGLISKLVYGGDQPAPESLVREAAARRVHLLSFIELQGLIDFRTLVDKQTRRLLADPVYPPPLYVPQRMRFKAGDGEEETDDALDQVTGWLRSPHGRFILLLGDSGTGKTFLLHELARRLGEGKSGLVPLLVEMRHLEKGRTLDQLLAQHFAREGHEDFSPGRFRYMLEQGRIALLFDGFDELTARVTYPKAAEHFDTLLQAALGSAKVVVTSRRQHFASDRQALTALGEEVELVAGRRVATLQPFDRDRIRRFLTGLCGGEEAAAARLALLDRVGDLAGLSHNPRMLGFIAELPEEWLREEGRELTAAGLYRLLLQRWLAGEYDRASVKDAAPGLSVADRLTAAGQLALRLWRQGGGTLGPTELTEEVALVLDALGRPDLDDAAFQVGSGSLLVRDDEGSFSFIHPSVLEWLVARHAAEEAGRGESPGVLGLREASPLLADFFADLAGRPQAVAWARAVLAGDDQGAAKANALLVLRRLGEEVREPARLAGRDLRGQDLSGHDLSGADLTWADLGAAHLAGTRLAGARLIGTKFPGADLTGADLSGARLAGADLTGARLAGARFRRTKLLGARFDPRSLDTCDTAGAALDPTESPVPHVAAPLPCTALAWSPDGALLATAEEALARLWDAATGREIRRLPGHTAAVKSVAFSPDGALLATASEDKTVRLWETATGRGIQTFTGHKSWAAGVAFSPDGTALASASYDHTVRVWDLATGKETLRLRGHRGWVQAVAWSPEGDFLVTAATDRTVRLWDLALGQEAHRFEGHEDYVLCAAWSPDGRAVATGSEDKTIRLWDMTRRRASRVLRGSTGSILHLAWSPDSHTLATVSDDRTVRLWDRRSGREALALTGHTAPVRGAAWSPDGKTLATAGEDRTVRLWNTTAGQESRRIARSDHAPLGLASHGSLLAAACADGALRLWDPVTGRETGRIPGHTAKIWSVAFRPDGCRLATASADRTVRLWDMDSGAEIRRFPTDGAAFTVAWSPDGLTLAAGSADRSVRLWSTETGTEKRRIEGHAGAVRGLAWSPDGRILASGSADRELRLWDVATGQEVRRLAGHESNVAAVAWSPDGQTLAAGSFDRAIHLWSVDTGEPRHRLQGHADTVWALAWSPDGKTLASAGFDRTVRLWDPATGRELLRLEGHDSRVLSLAWTSAGLLASGAGDNTLRLWDPATATCRALLGHLPEGWAAFTPTGRYKTGGTTAGSFWHTLALCRFEPGELDDLLPDLRMEPDEPF